MGLFSMFIKDLGIDLGTANTLVYMKGKGIVAREPSVVAIQRDTKKVLAVGEEAKKMIGRTPGNIVAIRPLKDGVIADFDITKAMLKHFIKQATKGRTIFQPRVVVCVPTGVTEVEKRAVEEAAIHAGARDAYLIEEPMAAAIGAGLPVQQPTGSMIVDIGGGTTEIAVISLGGIVTSQSIRTGGDNLDESIVTFIKKEYSLMIGERTAEDVKMDIGSADLSGEEKTFEIRGRDMITGLPKTVLVNSGEIFRAMEDPIYDIVEAIKSTLEKTPPELASDVMEQGIVLTGGGGLLDGFDRLISRETGIPVKIADSPLDCVAKGTGKSLESIDILKKSGSPIRRRR